MPLPMRTAEANKNRNWRRRETLDLTSWFSAIGFVVGGCVVFAVGFQSFAPSPPLSGQANCGTAGFGGAILMLVGTPLGACAAAIASGLLGRLTNALLQSRR